MSRLVIVVEKASDWSSYSPSDNVVTAKDYLKEAIRSDEERTQVINLCRSYKYLGTGYYVSLLAEARGHKVIPSVRTINDLRRRSLYGLDIEDFNQKLTRFLPQEGRDTTDFGILRMVADQPDAAVRLLKGAGFTARETDVIGVEVPDHPGELARIMALFRDEGVSIEYLYASLEHKEDKAVIVLKVDDIKAGLAMLEKHGFSTIPSF